MAIENRTVSIKNVFASTANTSIPNPPAAGVSYRNTSTTAAEIGEGWPYKEIVDSAKFNEAMYEYTTICQQLEKYGFLPWSANTDYLAGGCALGTDGNVYQAKVNTGPGSTALDPVSDTSHTIWDLFYYSTFTANRALVSNGSGKVATSSVTATELGYVHGVTSAIQTQLNNKAANNAVVHIAGTETITGAKTFSNTITGSISGNAGTVTNGVYTTGNQTIGGTKTFSNTIHGSINGNAATVTNGVYTTGNQTIGGTKTFSSTISGSINGNAATVTNGVYTTGNQTIGGTKTFSAVAYGKASAADNSILTTVSTSKSANGYFQLGNGLIVQWGRLQIHVHADKTVYTITLPKAFSSTNYTFCTCFENNTSSSPAYTDDATFVTTSISTTQVKGFGYDAGNNYYDAYIRWIAIGY